MKSFLIVGLGNIGAEYAGTRHNIGFDVVDALAKDKESSFETLRYGDLAKVSNKGKTAYLLKPNTFMNRSGKAVRYWMQQKKIPLQNILVITDDIHLDFGFLRIRKKGSDGGHNGLKDICAELNTTDYARLRFGIGAAFGKGRQVDFVLQPWKNEEAKSLPFVVDKAAQAAWCFMVEGIPAAMNTFNGNALDP
ncbi:MAG: aminoacyl-tRNA hydrolase [Bacteroidetes bacterium]|nr:aminoacyl-tRNA hydrolase [Bacteroidota bacterium]MDA1085006.1 aminoacyl-tRNA hydrolase [Bacteroidota bacterium]